MRNELKTSVLAKTLGDRLPAISVPGIPLPARNPSPPSERGSLAGRVLWVFLELFLQNDPSPPSGEGVHPPRADGAKRGNGEPEKLNSPSPFRRLALSPFRFIRWTVGTGLFQRISVQKVP
jgi:hypothetical protein